MARLLAQGFHHVQPPDLFSSVPQGIHRSFGKCSRCLFFFTMDSSTLSSLSAGGDDGQPAAVVPFGPEVPELPGSDRAPVLADAQVGGSPIALGPDTRNLHTARRSAHSYLCRI